ncbi:MAG: hypothetical protein AAGF24_09905 [Cyanobacteria bacterium P01_H01_bin.121]
MKADYVPNFEPRICLIEMSEAWRVARMGFFRDENDPHEVYGHFPTKMAALEFASRLEDPESASQWIEVKQMPFLTRMYGHVIRNGEVVEK